MHAPTRPRAALAAAVVALLALVLVPAAGARPRYLAERLDLRPASTHATACAARAHRLHHRRARAAALRACARPAKPVGRPTPASWPTPTPPASPSPSPAPASSPPPSPTSSPVPMPELSLTAAALDAGSVRLSWPPLAGAATAQVERDGAVVDAVPAGAGTFTDRGLWERTTYRYTVRLLDAAGAVLDTRTATATTPARTAFARLYADDAFVNRAVAAAPVRDPSSDAIVGRAVLPYASSANFSDDDDWAIPIVAADAGTATYDVGCDLYWCDKDWGPFPVPAGAQPSLGSDHHLAVVDPGGREMDMWLARRAGAGWSAGLRWLTRADGSAVNCAPGERCGGAVVAGFALAAGVVRPEEIAQGHIDHALMITTPYTRAGVKICPATNTDGTHDDPLALPVGAHVQLDPSLDVASLGLPAWQRTIAQALQVYGAYVVDTGGSLAVRAESNLGRGYDAWAKAGVPGGSPSLAGLPWSRLRVLAGTPC